MLNVALIGYGYWGPNVARNLVNNKEMNLKFICDKNQEMLAKAKKIYVGQTNYETDYKKLLTDSELDAIAIAVETSAHFDIAKECLNNGKHVYIEKPFTSTSEEALILNEIAKSENLIIHIDHIMMYHPIIQKMKSYIDSDEIGEPLYYDSARMNLGQIKQDVNAMWDLSIHDLSIVDYLLNGFNPEFISAVGEKQYSIKETLTFLTMKEKNFVAHMKSSWISPLKERRIIFAGTKKMIVYDDVKVNEKLMIYDKGVDILPESNIEYSEYVVKTRTGDCLVPYINSGDALFNSIEHFRGCVVEGKDSLSGPEQAIRLLKILENADQVMNK